MLTDPRITRLAQMLISSAIKLQKGENILIETTDTPTELSVELIRAAKAVGANSYVRNFDSRIQKEHVISSCKEALEAEAVIDLEQMKQMQAYISIRGAGNFLEMCDVPGDVMNMYRKVRKEVLNYRVNKTRWCVLRWPTASMAQAAKMSTEAFEDFYFDACLANYPAMAKAAESLVNLMNKTKKVRLVARDTDLSFSIDGIPAVPCCGTMNIPDGEVYTAPVRDSVNGVIHYNTPTIYDGKQFSDVRLVFENGKIVEATSSDTEALNKILDTDEGARYVGEFAIGFNPYVQNAICDILFDEKIAGSIHFTPGQSYEDAPNGNNSAIHWDLVLIMRPEYGGGEIWFDDRLIRKDGIFVAEELLGLNPDKLK